MVTRMTPRQRFDIYIAACDPAGGIYHYRLENGLRFVEKYDVDRPMWITIDGDFLYILLRELTDNLNSGVTRCKIAPDGSLYDFETPVMSEGRCACHASVSDGKLYLVNYLSGNVLAFDKMCLSRGSVCGDLHDGRGVHPTRQEAAHTHFVRESPDGKYIFCVDLGVDKIIIYDHELNKISEASVPAGEGCRHLDYSPDGKFVYCANELGSSVSVFGYENGRLSLIDTYKALPEDFKGQSTAAAIRVSPDGKFLYVSHRGHDSICVFDIVDGGRLASPEWTKIAGSSPRDFNFAGNYMFCANEKSNVTVFKVDGKSFEKLDDELEMPGALCVAVR